jgi:hypothetical protein
MKMSRSRAPAEAKPRRTSRSSRWRRTLPILALALWTAACSRHRVETNPDEPPADVLLTVVNHHWNDVRIYLIHDGVEERIGMVTAVTNASFVLPWRYFASRSPIQLRGRAVGDPDYVTTESLLVRPGQTIEWVLETQLARSAVSVN